MTGRISGTRRVKFRLAMRARDAAALAPCWLCGQPIDYTLTDGPDCWEPDHYHPVITHPHLQFDPANVRASHQRCNRGRGATAPAELSGHSLGMRSRNW